MLNTKEWYDLLEAFEKDVYGRTDREPKHLWPQYTYQDGQVNEQFQMYLKGYSLGKSVERTKQ